MKAIDDKHTDDIVCVLPGKWRCGEDGQWKFIMTRGQMARAVSIGANLSYHGLVSLVEDVFDVDAGEQSIHLTFWCPDMSNFCTQTKLPPVTIGCDSELMQFRCKLSDTKGLNIFVTFSEKFDQNIQTGSPSMVLEGDDPFGVEEDIHAQESMLALVESMENAHRQRMAEKTVPGHVDGNSNPDQSICYDDDLVQTCFDQVGTEARVMGRGQPTLLSIDDSDGPLEAQGQRYDAVDDDSIFMDPPPHPDNFTQYRPDETVRDRGLTRDALYVGNVFPSKKDLQTALGLSAIGTQVSYRLEKSDKTRMIAVCVDPNCKWRLYAKRHKDSDNFEIRTANPVHTCCVASRSKFGSRASSKVLGEVLTGKYAHGQKGPRACEIPSILMHEMNVDVSYMKAWYAKEAALSAARGKEEDSFNHLSTYLHLMAESNPGTLFDLHTTTIRENEKQFKYLFVAFGASVKGYTQLRKVVVIDGTQLKGKFKGCLVTASAQDGNMQIYPLAFGIVDSENENSWGWFLDNLQTFVMDDSELVFVSDRHASITAALNVVYPLAHHAACCVHLYRNVKARFKNAELAALTTKAARAYTLGDFRFYWEEIEKRSSLCATYLSNIGLPHWTLSHSPANRYNLMSSNISESLNAAMAKAVDLPIVPMIEFLRTMLMKWFAKRRELSSCCPTVCTPQIEEMLVAHHKDAVACTVVPASVWISQVNDPHGRVFTVDLESKTCTCMVINVLKIPCCHAIAAAKAKDVDIYTLVDKCYKTVTWREIYQDIIMPVARAEDNNEPDSVPLVDMLPPKSRRPPGRPRSIRIPSRGEGMYRWFQCSQRSDKKCGRCFRSGHNKSTCKNPI